MMLPTLLQFFAGTASCGQHSFFGLPTWYKYLAKAGYMQVSNITGRCEVTSGFDIPHIPLIGLALVDIALRVAALVAVGYVVYGGVLFVTAQGESDKTKQARQTIINALIGLVIALIATGIVSFIGTRIGG